MKKNNSEKTDSKLKECYNKLKEAWAIPQKKAGIKLLAYFIFFLIFFLIAGIVNRIGATNKIYSEEKTTTIQINEDKYTDKQKKLMNNKQNVNIVIKINDIEYKINGFYESNNISGYLEINDNIKKIIIENNKLYEVKNNENVEYNTDINCNILNLENIFDILKNSKTIIERNDKDTNYYYTSNISDVEYNIKVYTNENDIYKIEIVNDNSKYILNFDS